MGEKRRKDRQQAKDDLKIIQDAIKEKLTHPEGYIPVVIGHPGVGLLGKIDPKKNDISYVRTEDLKSWLLERRKADWTCDDLIDTLLEDLENGDV